MILFSTAVLMLENCSNPQNLKNPTLEQALHREIITYVHVHASQELEWVPAGLDFLVEKL